jgi:Ca2+-transporting ATPase
MWASEPVPFDPMEQTLHKVYEATQQQDERTSYKLFHEYPLEGRPPMMTHLFEHQQKERIIAAKGAPEAIIQVCKLSEREQDKIRLQVQYFAKSGFRVLGVAKSGFEGSHFPEKQQDFPFEFVGLVVFYDPPKKGITEVFQRIYEAGIKVKVITGDNADTTTSIAKQSGIRNTGEAIEGKTIMAADEESMQQEVAEKVLFTRMFPDAKLTVVNALKKQGEVVAMLGDGVNDGPALKAAHWCGNGQ